MQQAKIWDQPGRKTRTAPGTLRELMYWSRASSRSKGTSLSPMLAIACNTDRLFRLGSGNPHLLKRGVAWNILYLKLTELRNKMLVSFFSSSLHCLVVKFYTADLRAKYIFINNVRD